MHFFHPIQQCSQQVYSTALPLSPTSSKLSKPLLQRVYHQLSHVTAFSGAPDTWGTLLRTIDVRPKQLTCIATSIQGIIVACEDCTVIIYDAVTGVPQQSLCALEKVERIQGSPDGSILFFAHSFSVTMWDVQTGGLIHTFATQSRIHDIAVSTGGDHIACGCDSFITFWDINTRVGGGNVLGMTNQLCPFVGCHPRNLQL